MAKLKKLDPFEGKDVVGTAIAIKGLGDGLSKQVKTDPTVFHHGDRAFVLVEVVCMDVSHPPIDRNDPAGPVNRKHDFKAEIVTIMDSVDAQASIDRQRAKNDELEGVIQADFTKNVNDEDPDPDDEFMGEPGDHRPEDADSGD